MKKKIAIILPYKEIYSENFAGAASIWVKDYINLSKLQSTEVHALDVLWALDDKDAPREKPCEHGEGAEDERRSRSRCGP